MARLLACAALLSASSAFMGCGDATDRPVDASVGSDAAMDHASYREAARLSENPFSPCDLHIPMEPSSPVLPELAARRIRDAEEGYGILAERLITVASAPVGSTDPEAESVVFGPVPEAAGYAALHVTVAPPAHAGRRHVLRLLWGPEPDAERMTAVLSVDREVEVSSGAVLESLIVWRGREERDAKRAAGLGPSTLPDGRLVIRQTAEPSGVESDYALAVFGDWLSPGAETVTVGSAACGRWVREDLPLGVASASLNEDLGDPPDGRPERLVVRMGFAPDTGGRAEALVREGNRLIGVSTVAECWDADLARVVAAINDGSETRVEPAGATAADCPAPFEQSLAELLGPLAGEENENADLLGLAYDGLHRPLTFDTRGRRVLWVGAHPDDEQAYAAPVLGRLCRDLGGECTMLVANDGGVGNCGLPEGCSPDLGTVRRAEMLRAAELYGATLHHWDWGNLLFPGSTVETLELWSDQLGGTPELVAAIADLLLSVNPEIILLPDPRHGVSCHAEHRVIATLLLQAVEETALSPRIYFSQGSGGPPRFVDEHLLAYDATEPSETTGTDTWEFGRLNALAHPSQIPPESVAAWARVPPAHRRLYFLALEDLQPDDERYQICPNP